MSSNASSTACWLRWAVALGLSGAGILGYSSDDASGLGVSLDPAVRRDAKARLAVEQQRLKLLARILEQGGLGDAPPNSPNATATAERSIETAWNQVGTSSHHLDYNPQQAVASTVVFEESLVSETTQLAQIIPIGRPVEQSMMSASEIVEEATLLESSGAVDPLDEIERLEAVEPAASITFRRDTVEPPLLESERWTEWVLSVAINDREVSDGSVFIRDPVFDRLAVELATAQSWRLLIDRNLVLSFGGVPFYPLDAIPGLQLELDETALSIQLQIPPDAFELSRVEVEDGPSEPPSPGTGAFFDYDVLASGGQEIDEQVDGLFEAGLFAAGAVLIGNVRLQDATSDPEIQRLETTLSKDFPSKRATFRLGDSLTVGGSFAEGVRFGGLQWATNFATDPAFVTFPLPTIGGLAQQDSVVDVIVDNLTQDTRNVPPGPFAIENVPVVTGAGEVQLRVTDLLGREQLITQSYYVSSRLLKEGLNEFSYEVGFARKDFGRKSFDYGDVLGTATHRHGFTNAVTGEIHAEATNERVSLVGGGALLLGSYGLLTGGVGGSADHEQGEGGLAQMAYEYIGQRFSIGARTRFTSSSFRQSGTDDGRFERVDQFTVGFDALTNGRVGLLLLNQERNDGDSRRSATASYSVAIGPGSLILNAGRTFSPNRDYVVTAAYSVPLGPTRSITATARSSNDSGRGGLQYTRTRGASELALDYRVAGEVGENSRPIDARLGYQASWIGTDIDVERTSNNNRFRLGVNGSAALVDGNFGLTRRIGRAFGLVDLPGFPNVRVYLDNRIVGQTNADGQLFLPDLRPYERNRVRLAVEDLPLSADFIMAETPAVPFDRSGMTIDFGIVSVERATVTLTDKQDSPLPPGLVLASDGGELEAMVGREGFAQLTGKLASRSYLIGDANGRHFVCAIPAAPSEDPLPHLGDVRCAG